MTPSRRGGQHACDLEAPPAPEIGPDPVRARLLQRAQRQDPRRGRFPGRLHDRLRDLARAARDARGASGGSLDEAIRRANAYLEAGADLAFVEGPTSVEEVRRVCREVKGPVFYNQTGVSPRFSLAEMQELGIAVTIIPGATFRATIEAVYDLAVALRDEGPLAEERFAERFKRHPLGDLHTFAGFDRIREWEAQYLPPEELEKYAGSIGHQPASA